MIPLRRTPLAVRGALTFLSRLPLGGGERAWDAFRRTPASFPIAGYVLGFVVAVPFLLGLAPETTVALYLFVVYGLTGITHVDGLADLADAAAVHGRAATDDDGSTAADARRAVMKDASTGVGGTLAVALAIGSLALAALWLASPGSTASPSAVGAVGGLPAPIDGSIHVVRAVATLVAAEVGAKTGMGVLACLGTPAHEGLGSELVSVNTPAGLVSLALATIPATLLAGRGGVGALMAVVLAGPTTALLVRRFARRRLGGVSGDAFGAVNELARIAGLHVGVIAWTLS